MKLRYKLLIGLAFVLALPNLGYFSMLVVAVPDLDLFSKGKQVSQPMEGTSGFVKDGNGMEFVPIPAGRFRMGTVFGAEVSADEMPLHEVTISHPFYLGRHEVTQAQWETVMGSNPSEFKGADRPVENISWEEAQTFIGKLNDQAGTAIYRLPTEAEWEYAARAGTETIRYWGDGAEEMDQYAWYANNSGKRSRPVGQLKPNAWGLQDMLGNVWEWCQDWYGSTYYPNAPATDPQGPAEGVGRVMRGGGWNGYVSHIRAAYRFELNPTHRRRNLGMRVLMERVL